MDFIEHVAYLGMSESSSLKDSFACSTTTMPESWKSSTLSAVFSAFAVSFVDYPTRTSISNSYSTFELSSPTVACRTP